jgi:hypothetical protein
VAEAPGAHRHSDNLALSATKPRLALPLGYRAAGWSGNFRKS